jgi:hypothetical protein
MKNISESLSSAFEFVKEVSRKNKTLAIGVLGLVIVGVIFVYSKSQDNKKVTRIQHSEPTFKNGRILGSQGSSYLKEKENQLGKAAKKILLQNKRLLERLKEVEAK